MEIPNELRHAIEDITKNKTSQLVKPAQTISRRYRAHSGTNARLLSTEYEAFAYAASRMPATYASVRLALKHIADLFDGGQIESLLDIGAGTGAASWAAASAFSFLKDITCLERESAMQKIGMEIALSGSQALQNAKWINHDIAKDKILQTADIVISSYVLNEMTNETRAEVINKLWLATNKILLIVEPGTPKNFSQMYNVRQLLLENGAHILAPCPHNSKCPIPQTDITPSKTTNWCHFTSRVSRSRTHRQLKDGHAPYEDEKFTYIAAARNTYQHPCARILRHPIISSGFVTLELCTGYGIKKTTISKKDGELYKKARKAKTGDTIDI